MRVVSKTPSPLTIPLRGLAQPRGAGRRHPPVAQRAVRVQVADRLGAAAVHIHNRDVGPGQVDVAGAVIILLRRHRQAVGTGGRDGPVLQRSVGIVVRNGRDHAAVGVHHARLDLLEVTVATRIDLRRRALAVGADRGHQFRLQRAVRVGAGHGLGAAAIRADDGDVRHRQVENTVSRRCPAGSSSTAHWRWS